MHSFDDPDEATDTGEEFEQLLDGFASPSPSVLSAQAESEVKCFWMALGVLCPEAKRLEYEAKKDAKQLDDYAIALQIRIPEIYVPRLFEPRYKENIAALSQSN